MCKWLIRSIDNKLSKAFRREGSLPIKRHTVAVNGRTSMDERRPLLGNGNGNGIGLGGSETSGTWSDVFLNPRSTPGTASPNPFVKYPARVWNVTKVTLLSCTYSATNGPDLN